jgi:hypothetical protein
VTTTPRKFTADGDGEPIEVEALVSYEFYRPPMVTQEKIRQHQSWRFVVLERRWVLDFDFEAFDARARGSSPVPAAAAPIQ